MCWNPKAVLVSVQLENSRGDCLLALWKAIWEVIFLFLLVSKTILAQTRFLPSLHDSLSFDLTWE